MIRVLLTFETEIIIKNTPETIYKFITDPANWTASNPKEHFGLKYFSEDGRPRTGAKFYQREKVGGLYADLHGYFLYVDVPKIGVWRGVATYKLLGGLIRYRIPEGGIIKLEKTSGGTKLSHNYYMDFPDTLIGKLVLWYFKNRRNGEKAAYDHGYKELIHFKEQLEK